MKPINTDKGRRALERLIARRLGMYTEDLETTNFRKWRAAQQKAQERAAREAQAAAA